MKEKIDNLSERICFYISEEMHYFIKYILLGMILGVLVYLPLMSNNLVNNYDGIWHTSYFLAGDWEISLGRGLQRYADRARFGLVSSSLNSLLVIFFITAGDYFIIKRFQSKRKFVNYLFLLISIANPVVCESLTYSYMSVNFALAFFFSVIAFYVLMIPLLNWKNYVIAIIAGLFLAISMSFYQAYIGVTCILVFFYLVKQCKENINTKIIGSMILKAMIMLGTGGIFYFSLTKLLCWRAGIELGNYKGANNISISFIIQSLPQTIVTCYQEFWNYLIVNCLNINLEFCKILILVSCLVLLLIFVFTFIQIYKTNKINCFIFVLCCIFLPIAACFVCLIAVGNTITGLMAMGILFCVIIPLFIVDSSYFSKLIYGILMICMSFYLLSAVERDQIALQEGKTATITLTQNIVSQIYENSDADEYTSVAFVGRAADNPAFHKSYIMETANHYAQFGYWSTAPRNNRVTWLGILNAFCGTSFNLCPDDLYSELIATENLKSMPVFPANGSIKVIDHVLIVKVSNNY